MADFFKRFGTTTEAVSQWVASLGKTLTADAIATAESAAPAAPAPRKELTTDEWKQKIDLKKYKSGKRLGAGDFGETHLFVNPEAGAPLLVVKTAKPAGVAELNNEARLYAQAGDHPNLCKCLGMQKIDGQDRLVLEGIKGKNMTDSMADLRASYNSGKLSHEEFYGAMQHNIRGILQATAHLASKGVVHNDLRTDNVMCDETSGGVKVFDFGVSTATGEKTEKTPWHGGTVSPEFAQDMIKAHFANQKDASSPLGAVPTEKHDVFSVGSTAFQMNEQTRFEYNAPVGKQGKPGAPVPARNVANYGKQVGGQNQSPVQPVAPGEASRVNAAGKTEKKPGVYAEGYESAYVEFLKALMNPDPTKRPTAAEALEMPFMKDSLLDEEAARKVLSKAISQPKVAPPSQPKRNTDVDDMAGEGVGSESEEHVYDGFKETASNKSPKSNKYSPITASDSTENKKKYDPLGEEAGERQEEEEEEPLTRKSKKSSGGGRPADSPEYTASILRSGGSSEDYEAKYTTDIFKSESGESSEDENEEQPHGQTGSKAGGASKDDEPKYTTDVFKSESGESSEDENEEQPHGQTESKAGGASKDDEPKYTTDVFKSESGESREEEEEEEDLTREKSSKKSPSGGAGTASKPNYTDTIMGRKDSESEGSETETEDKLAGGNKYDSLAAEAGESEESESDEGSSSKKPNKRR